MGSVHLSLQSSRPGAGKWAAGVTQRRAFTTHARHYSCWTPTGVWVQSGQTAKAGAGTWSSGTSHSGGKHVFSISLIPSEGVL